MTAQERAKQGTATVATPAPTPAPTAADLLYSFNAPSESEMVAPPPFDASLLPSQQQQQQQFADDQQDEAPPAFHANILPPQSTATNTNTAPMSILQKLDASHWKCESHVLSSMSDCFSRCHSRR